MLPSPRSLPESLNLPLLYTTWPMNTYLWVFLAMFFFRYVRAVTNLIAYKCYRPVPISKQPLYRPEDVTVIIPTHRLDDPVFHKVVLSLLKHDIAALLIASAGNKATPLIVQLQDMFHDPRINILHRKNPNRREQTAMAVNIVSTSLLVISDDHTFFPENISTFVPSLIAPFEDPLVGAVGPVLKPKHHHHPFSWRGFWNFMGMTYLLRRAHEFLATNTIDGGLSCLSSRFAVFRTEIYADPKFKQEYLNEYMFWGLIGPLNADDDKFHTRWLAKNGWKIKIQGGPESVMETENVGVWPFFHDQLLRWNRTTWRSNPRTLLFDHINWFRFPYTTYSVLLYSFVRFTAAYEILLFWTLKVGRKETHFDRSYIPVAVCLFIWIIGMKAIKILPHFRKYPTDLVYFPGYLLFGWYCTIVKVWTLLTFWNTFWSLAGTKVVIGKEIVTFLETDGIPVIEGVDVTESYDLTPVDATKSRKTFMFER